MTRKQALELVVRMYRKHGGGSRQHLIALARYEKIAYGCLINGKE